MLSVRLAGGLALELDGRELALPRSRRARALLAWLALAPGTHARGELAGRFWPDVLDESARTSLRAALSELRAALGPGAAHLVTTRETVSLGGDGLQVDVRAFDQLLAEGRPADAVEECAGELLAGFDDDWVHEARAAHRERLAAAIEQLAQSAETAGDHREAIRRTRAVVALDPLAEEPNRRLIERLAAAGDRSSAIAAYDQLSERLRTVLGIAPSAATRELATAIRSADTAAAPEPLAVPAAVRRAADTPFVGREAELRRMRATWAGVRLHDARRLVLLAGDPGAGKTRLALELASKILDDGGVPLYGRCSEEPLRAFEPFAECLRQAGGRDRVLEQPLADDPGARHRLFAAVDEALAEAAAGRPLLLLLDDLHWADRPTLLLLAFLLRSERRVAMLVLGTYRTSELGRRTPLTGALAELRRDGALERVAVDGLEPDDVAALAEIWLGAGAGERVAADVHSRTAGNAFFVEEVLRALAEKTADPVPESIRHAVAARLAHLSEAAEELAGVAAVLASELDVAVLVAVAGLPEDAAERALDELLAANILRRAPGTATTVEFPHALVREAVLHELNAVRRARLHRRAADVLIGVSEERHLEAIAHHLFEAADSDRAAAYLARAGERSMAMLAYEQAAEHYERAIEVRGGDDGELLLARGEALTRAGEPAAARECFAQAAAVARRRHDPRLLARAALGHGGLGIAIIDVDERRVALLEEALEAIGEDDPLLASELLGRLALELYYAPSRDRSEGFSAEAVSAARAAGDARAVAAALGARHVALWRPDRLTERRAVAEEMIEVARTAGDRALELQGRNWLVTDLWELGEIAMWRAEVARHAALADQQRLPMFTWYGPLWNAVDALHAGRFEEATRLRAVAREAGERAGERNADLFDKMLEFVEMAIRGDHGGADMAFLAEKLADSPAAMSYRSSYAWILATRGEHNAARRQLAIVARDDFADLKFDANWLSALGECAEAVAILGERSVAVRLYELLAPYAGRPLAAGRAIASYGTADRHLGLLAGVLGDHAAAVAHLETGIALDGERGMQPWAVHGRRALADALEASGARDRGATERDRARAEARELGLSVVGPQGS